MAVAGARITAFLKTVADASADLLMKIAYGTPGSEVMYPESTPDNQTTTRAQDTGELYSSVVIPGLIAQVGAEMDRAACIWAWVQTNGAGVAPTIPVGHTNVASASKNEVADTLQITLSPAYVSGYFCTMTVAQPGSIYIPVNTLIDSAHFAFAFYDEAGSVLNINDLTVLVFACGQV